MQLKDSIKRTGIVFGVALLLSVAAAVAQEERSEISVPGTGFFTKDINGSGIQERATETGGLLLGYRYNINRWLSAEADYGYDRNTQVYFGSGAARVQANIHQSA
jgi:hypothetical protein